MVARELRLQDYFGQGETEMVETEADYILVTPGHLWLSKDQMRLLHRNFTAYIQSSHELASPGSTATFLLRAGEG
jgi:hypothetical protein